MSSRLLFQAATAWTSAPVSVMIYGWRDREEMLRLFEKITGLRMNHNYIRPGGVAADLPDGWRDDLLRIFDALPEHLEDLDTLLTGQPIWRERLQGVGMISTEEALDLGATGPILRSTGYLGSSAGTCPTCATTSQVDFDVVVGTFGDCFDRYAIRLQRDPGVDEDRLPDPRGSAKGDYKAQDRKVTRLRARIDESMEALITTSRSTARKPRCPRARSTAVAVESPRRARLLHSSPTARRSPHRMHIRG
ncbi:MAG: hypothetical protein R2749_02325 [Acidimicrobiales bacterium]